MISRAFSPLAFALLLLVAWQAIAVIGQIPEYLLPSPTAIIATVDRSLAVSFAVTFIEALAGFLIASVLAFAIATLFVRFQALEGGLFPIAIAVKTTPIVAIAPLLVIWLGTGWWSKIVAAMLICFFPVLVNMSSSPSLASSSALRKASVISSLFPRRISKRRRCFRQSSPPLLPE
jgi:NitT/TauT family transport system permease protein